MTLPASGSITLGQVAGELGISLPLSLGDSRVLALAGKSAPPISLSDLYGKSAYTPMSGSMPDVDVNGTANNSVAYTASAQVGITITGGLAPFNCAWSHVSGIGTVDSASASSTQARMPVPKLGAPGPAGSQVVQVIVTDAKGNTLTKQCTVALTLS